MMQTLNLILVSQLVAQGTRLFYFILFFLIGNQKFINKEKKEKKSTSCS